MVTKISGGRRNQDTAEILVILLDVNDNAPELPTDLRWSISENEDVVGYKLHMLKTIWLMYINFAFCTTTPKTLPGISSRS